MKEMQTAQVRTRPTDVRSALGEGIRRLEAAEVHSSKLASELLLMHTLQRDRTWLYAHATDGLDRDLAEKYLTLIARRAAGEPTQYILGKQEFWGLEFEVTPAVLVPRPETEHIIEVALARIGEPNRAVPRSMADVGTGSGCLAVTLAKVFPNARLVATDISADALKVASRNAARHGVQARIEFVEDDLLTHRMPEESAKRSPGGDRALALGARFDLIVSNPPYVALSDADSLPREVRDHEPKIALFGGPTGVELYSRLIAQAETLLGTDGFLILELGYGAAERIRRMIASRSAWKNVNITNDLAGIPRVLVSERA